MQLLKSVSNRLSDADPQLFIYSLQDIAQNIQIESNFCISHPSYKPLELPVEMVSRIQKAPLSLQQKYQGLQLRSFLYGTYYNGSLKQALSPKTDAVEQVLHQDLENNTVLGIDLEFYERLHESNHGEGYFDPDWTLLRREKDGCLAVTKGGLILHVKQDLHLRPSDYSATIGSSIAIKMPRNVVQSGFYMAVSNAGSNTQPQTVRIYFNLTPEGAVAVMGRLTRELNAATIPFTFKVLYDPSNYERHDSGVLYFERSNYEIVWQILQTIYQDQKSCFRTEIPLFTKKLAPGLALAEEPNHKFSAKESFGTHRCQIVANGLLEAWQKGDNSPENRMMCISQHFSQLGIDLERPYLNADSEDVYTPLDL